MRFTGDYSGETAYNAHGGQHRSARYSQNLKFWCAVRPGQALRNFTNGDRIQVTVTDRRGNSASRGPGGNRLPIQENYGGL